MIQDLLTERRSDVPEFSLSLSHEQRDLRDRVHAFAAAVVRPGAALWDEREEMPWPIIQEAAKADLYSFEFLVGCYADPTGLGLCLASEELFWGDAGIGLAIMGTAMATAVIFSSGTPEQIVQWVPQCFGDATDPKAAAFCSTEPGAGSDLGAISTFARYDQASDQWILDGRKAFVTNGGIANVHVVVASVEPELRSHGLAAFVVPGGTKGLQSTNKLRKLGLRASHTADLLLDDVRIPGACLLGGLDALQARLARARTGGGVLDKTTSRTFEVARPIVGAQALGIARAAYEYALGFARTRFHGGRLIVENQSAAFALANMCTEIDAARLLVWRAAWMAQTRRPFTSGEGSMSKLKASEVAVAVTESALQILGHEGYSREHPVQRWYRDAKVYTIFDGTSEIQRLIIARAISGAALR